jgi:hypothetical protein
MQIKIIILLLLMLLSIIVLPEWTSEEFEELIHKVGPSIIYFCTS